MTGKFQRFKLLTYLHDHENEMKQKLKESPADRDDLTELLSRNRLKIVWFQQERLAHLGVLMLTGILTFISLGLSLWFPQVLALLALTFILAILTAAYIRYYYLLENSLHRLYHLDDLLAVRLRS